MLAFHSRSLLGQLGLTEFDAQFLPARLLRAAWPRAAGLGRDAAAIQADAAGVRFRIDQRNFHARSALEMRRRIRRDHHQLPLHGDSKCLPFSLSILEIRKASYRRDAELRRKTRAKKKTRRSPRLGGEKALIPAPTARTAAQNASAIHRRKRAASAPSIKPVIVRERQRKNQARLEFVVTHSAPSANAKGPESRLRDDSRWARTRCRRSAQIGDGESPALHLLGSELAVAAPSSTAASSPAASSTMFFCPHREHRHQQSHPVTRMSGLTIVDLLVPVIRDVDKKNIVELAAEMTQRRRGARPQAHSRGDGGRDFHHHNLGGIAGTGFSPIRESSRSRDSGPFAFADGAGVVNNKFEPRLILPLSLSYDHRLDRCADAARFCAASERAISPMIHDHHWLYISRFSSPRGTRHRFSFCSCFFSSSGVSAVKGLRFRG